MTVRLSGRLPEGDHDGLASIVRALVDQPTSVHVLIAICDVAKVTTEVDTGDVVPTVRLRRVEVITDAADSHRMRRLLVREYERRTGKEVLPLDLEDELRDALEPPPAQ